MKCDVQGLEKASKSSDSDRKAGGLGQIRLTEIALGKPKELGFDELLEFLSAYPVHGGGVAVGLEIAVPDGLAALNAEGLLVAVGVEQEHQTREIAASLAVTVDQLLVEAEGQHVLALEESPGQCEARGLGEEILHEVVDYCLHCILY